MNAASRIDDMWKNIKTENRNNKREYMDDSSEDMPRVKRDKRKGKREFFYQKLHVNIFSG
jgi:hypothetical protein